MHFLDAMTPNYLSGHALHRRGGAHERLAHSVYAWQARAPYHARRDGPSLNLSEAVRDPARPYISRLTAVDGRTMEVL